MANDAVMVALSTQVDCYRRLSRLAELQHEHVQQSQTEQLLEVLARRQEVLDQIATLEQTIAPARKRWADYVADLDPAARRQAEALLAEARGLLEAIVAADRNDALVLQQRKLNLSQAIGQANTARQVNRSYAAAAYGRSPARMDVRQ